MAKLVKAKKQTVLLDFESTSLKDYKGIKSILEEYSQFTEGQLRWWVVRHKELGLTPAIKKLGRRIYFHMPTLLKWVDSQSI